MKDKTCVSARDIYFLRTHTRVESSREPGGGGEGGDVHVEMLNLSFIINLVFIVLDGSIFGAREHGQCGRECRKSRLRRDPRNARPRDASHFILSISAGLLFGS